MDVIVVGCGSIGRRHVAALLDMPQVGRVTVVTAFDGCAAALPHDERVHVVGSLGEAEGTHAVVANDTDRHAATAVELLGRGADVLVEKPVALTAAEAEHVGAAASRTGAAIRVGYNLRFLPALSWVRDRLADGAIGTPYFARIEAGHDLAAWRPHRDHRESYSAHAARGGSVALDLSHELDYMRFLFGDPADWKVVRSRVADVTVDSDDVFEGVYRWTGGLVVSVHLDYLEPERRRGIRVLGSAGTIECDLAGGRIARTPPDGGTPEVLDDPAMFDVSATYPSELAAFLGATAGAVAGAEGADSARLATLDDGVWALRLADDGREEGHARV